MVEDKPAKLLYLAILYVNKNVLQLSIKNTCSFSHSASGQLDMLLPFTKLFLRYCFLFIYFFILKLITYTLRKNIPRIPFPSTLKKLWWRPMIWKRRFALQLYKSDTLSNIAWKLIIPSFRFCFVMTKTQE